MIKKMDLLEAAKFFKRHPATIRLWIKLGKVKHEKIDGKYFVLVDKEKEKPDAIEKIKQD
jgi:hypothetical protein